MAKISSSIPKGGFFRYSLPGACTLGFARSSARLGTLPSGVTPPPPLVQKQTQNLGAPHLSLFPERDRLSPACQPVGPA
jgi:hypothetical protein